MNLELEISDSQAVLVGAMGFVEGRGEKLFMVIARTGDGLRVKEWPIADAPPADEITLEQWRWEGDRE